MTVEESVSELVGRVATGDQAAFDELYRLVAARVVATVRRKLVDPSQSDEVAQEVLLEVWQQAARFDAGRGHALGWILTMASRRAIDRVRSSQAARDRERWVAEHSQETPHDHVWEHVASIYDRDLLAQALGRITPLQREAVTITYLHGHTIAEAARVVGASESAVKTRVRDGIIGLRSAIWESQSAA